MGPFARLFFIVALAVSASDLAAQAGQQTVKLYKGIARGSES